MEPTPEWLICEDIYGDRTFVFHSGEPRFLCEIIDEGLGDASAAPPSHRMRDGRTVGGFVWFGPAPAAPEEIGNFARKAAEALEDYEDNLEAEYGEEEY